jgi:beta-glucosidase
MEIVKSGYDYTVSVNVRNVGDIPGKEAVQLYVAAPGSDKPLKELRAFAKTGLLEPGQSQRITMTFTTYDLASFDEECGMWITEKGIYRCLLGASSADIRLSDDFAVYSRISTPVHSMTR